MKNYNLIERLFTDSHEKQTPQRFGRYAVMLIMLLTLGVGQMWAYWYVPGTINGTRWGTTDNNMGGDNTIIFYAVPAGTYSFQLTNGTDWGGNGCIESISGATKGTDGSNATITTTAVKDIKIQVTNESTWKVTVTASDPTYHIKYQFGGSWDIKTLKSNGDGTYSCNGNYSGSSSSGFNYIKVSSEGDDFMNWTTSGITRENSPSSSSDKCIFTFKPSDNTLKIRKCNTVTKTNYIYFYNRHSWSDSYIYFVIGHPEYSATYRVTNIANTKLYYVANSSDNWTDAGYYGMIGAGSTFGGGSWGQSNLAAANHYTAAYTTARNLANGKTILVTPNATNSNGQAMTISSDMSSYTGLNYSQTVQKRTCTGANDPSAVANYTQTEVNSGTVTISAYKMTGNGTASNTSNSATLDEASETSTSVDAAYSGKVTYTASANTGYTFVGWTTSALGSVTSTDATYNRYPTSSGTVFARFKENQYTAYVQTYTHGSSPSPSSATTMGQVSGGSVSVTPNTGYRFVNWTLNSGSGSFADANSASTTFYPTSNSQLRANIVAKTYTITLDDNGDYGGNGSATATYNSSTLSIASHATREDYRIDGYQTSGGTKVINADGSLVASISGYTDGSSNWIKDDNVTLYAIWVYDVTNYTVTYGAGTDYTSYGSVSAYDNTASAAAGDSPASVRSGHSVTFTATPETGYEIEGWYTNAACSAGKHDAGNSTYTVVSVTGDLDVYVKFVEKTWSVAFAAGTGGSVTTPNSSPKTVGQLTGISIAATPSTGYSFSSWSSSSGGSFVSGTSTNSNTFKPTANTTVTASFSEIMRTISISGGTIYGGSATSTTAGVATAAKITANAPAAGKKFTGWTLGTGVSLKAGSSLTDRTIEIYSTANATVTANYADRASVKVYFAKPSGWSTVYAHAWKDGGTGTTWPGVNITSNTETINYVTYYYLLYYTEADGIGNAATGSSTWNEVKFSDNGDGTKRTADLSLVNGHYYFQSTEEGTSGKTAALTSAWCIKGSFNSWSEDADQITHSAAATGSKSITLTTGDKTFKIYNIVEQTWWRFSGNVTATKSATAMDNSSGDMTITPSVAGPYTFALASLTGTPTLAITYPTTYTVTFNAETFVNGGASHSTSTTGGTLSAVDGNEATLTSGGKVISGGSAVITATATDPGYTFIGFYTNAACTTAVSGAGVSISDNVLTYTGISGNKTVYAKFSENMTTVNLVASPTGKGTFTKGGAAVTSVSAGVTTKPAVTAVAATGYRVNTSATVWSESSDYISISPANAATTTITATGTSGNSATLTATFTPKTYTITLHEQGATTSGTPGDGGTITATYDATTNLEKITAVPERTGYTFGGYYDTEECDGTWIIKTDTYFNWDGTYLNSSTGVWKYDGNLDLYAKWTANQYTVTLDVDEANKGTTASATESQDIYYDDATVTVPNLPTAAEGYKFDGYYTDHLGEGTKVINANGTWIASITGYTDASKHWVHTDDVTLYAYYKKAEITALTLDATVVETNATVGLTPTISPTPEGNTKLCFYVFHSNDNPLDPQPRMTYEDGKLTFSAGETSGTYKIGVALRTGTECGGGTLLDSTTISYQVAGTHSVTVRYKCGDEVIKAASSLEGIRPLDWSDAITAPNIIGYSFTGWSAGDGVTLTDDDGSSTKTSTAAATIKIKAIYDGYLTANYSKKRIIYFNNTLNWENVYVYFYKNGTYWDATYGTGCNTGYQYTDYPFSESLYGQMQPVEEGSKIYYFDAEAAGVNASYQTVVFTELDQHTYNWFSDKNKVIKRDDYYSSKLPMYVPLAVQTADPKNGNTADYYWQGYWMNYPENTGYTLKIYNKKTRSDAPDAGSKDPVELKSIPFEFTADKTMPMELDVDLEAGQTYGFKIWRNDGLNTGAGSYYGNTGTMTANAEGWDMKTTASSNAGLQTTAAGNYKFLLNFYEVSSDYQYRVSVTYPVATGDYRLVYKDNVQTKEFKSAIIPKAKAQDTVSFFVRKGQSANLKLQKCTGLGAGTVTWTDTVTWWNNGTGIHSAVTQDSVYNICLKHDASTNELQIENVEAYTGNYYIRTDAANSKWDNYRTDPDHLMTYSEYSINHGGYSHYYTHWIQTDDRKNVKFVIANDYSPNISDTLVRESNAVSGWENINNYIESNGDLKRNANVRFMWDRHTNTISRAYVDGAQGDNSANFLYILNTDATDKIRWSAESALTNQKVTFMDNGDWIYEANIQAQPNAQIRLLSNWGTSSTITQYFKGSSSTSEDLVGGSGSTWYDIRVIYDFKTNRLVASYIPRGEIDDEIEINADVMFIREHQGDIDQLTFKEKDDKMGAISKIETAYGVLRLNKWTINNKSKEGDHDPLSPLLSRYERDLFYVSFPFRVSMEEVFGFGTYGQHWIIEEYDGASRAANGYWQESGPNWKFVFNRKNKFFEPYQGYIIALDLDEMSESSSIWTNAEQVELYFPSYGTMSDITNASVNCTIPEHLCTINRSEEIGGGGVPLGSAYDRRVKDSHWNVISVPTYVNTKNVTFANTDWITTATATSVGPNFLYEWNPNDNSVTARSGVGYTYKAMHAYLVQYCGRITWTSSVSPAAAPRRNPAYRGEYEFRLELQQNDVTVDQAYVKLSDNEHVTTGFEFNYDLSKEFNASKSNIYTLIGTEQAAGNVLPLTKQTTVIPVGVKAVTNGDYTFSMPDGTEGIGITLIDNETGIRTSLSALDYTIYLDAGTYENRFVLEISPIRPISTDLESISDEGLEIRGARKVLIDGLLYIVKDGKMFDAQGRQVK